jgi:hypothetical protein
MLENQNRKIDREVRIYEPQTSRRYIDCPSSGWPTRRNRAISG